MKLKHGRESAWSDAAPHRIAFRAGVLVDDLVHKGVSSASDRLEERGTGKRKQAYLAATAGLIAGTVLYYREPDAGRAMILSMQNFAALFASVAVFEPLSAKPAQSEGAKAETPLGLFAKLARLPILLGSAAALVYAHIAENASISLASGLVWGAYAIGLYILSASTGMIDRIRDWAAELSAPERGLAPVPVKIKD